MIDKYFKNYNTEVEVIIQKERVQQMNTLDDFKTELTLFLREPFGKQFKIELHDKELNSVECSIVTYDSEEFQVVVESREKDVHKDNVFKTLCEMVEFEFGEIHEQLEDDEDTDFDFFADDSPFENDLAELGD